MAVRQARGQPMTGNLETRRARIHAEGSTLPRPTRSGEAISRRIPDKDGCSPQEKETWPSIGKGLSTYPKKELPVWR
jgi:hypothetical protein